MQDGIITAEPIKITLKLEVLPNNKILVPGCEPSSGVSSTLLAASRAKGTCGDALVDLSLAIANIPGSTIEIGYNFGRGFTQKWFVLPPRPVVCPCPDYPDYYSILRGLAQPEDEVVVESMCGTTDMGFCPSPDFENAAIPPDDPYLEPGSIFGGSGVLPPLPPWLE